MRSLSSALVLFAFLFGAAPVAAQGPAPVRQMEQTPALLAPLVGRWTIKGQEDRYLETCRWFEGNRHVVCESERRGTDGAVRKGMRVFGFQADRDRFSLHEIDSDGGSEVLFGHYRKDRFEFTAPARVQGKPVIKRLRIGGFAAREVPFVTDTATEGQWTVDADLVYVRLD